MTPLTSKEEQALSVEERTAYYKELREYLLQRPLQTTTKGALKIAPKLRKATQKIAVKVVQTFTNKNIQWVCDGKENIPDGAVLFAHTHQGVLDGFVWLPYMDRHCVILHSIDTSKVLLLCQVNTGLVLVKKGNRESSFNAKLDMIRILLEGHSIAYFPEGAWNLSPNKLILPMSYGFLDVALKTQERLFMFPRRMILVKNYWNMRSRYRQSVGI